MRCRSVLTRVDALRTGELEAEEQKVVSEHLKTCKSCDASVDDVNGIANVVKRVLAVVPPRSCRDAVVSQTCDSFDRAGATWVAWSERGLRMLRDGLSEDEFRSQYAERYGRTLVRASLPDALRQQVLAAHEGHGVDKPKVDLGDAEALEEEVLRVLTKIPRGEVRTYAWVAEQVGRPKAARAIGTICANNAVPFVVPCHRVVPASGGVGEYLFGRARKRELLQREGVDVERLDSLGRRGVRFIGSRTTKIVCNPTCKDARRIREENVVPFRAAGEAVAKGFRPCRRCRPFAA